ncbi:MAG: response regulator transcription factor [Candidatus Dormiibacterota bacterium]
MAEVAPSAGAGRKVLLVEDDEAVRMTLRYNLAAVGYVVLEAASGTRGLELARSRTPDLVVLDLMLPELTGEEVCRILRQESNVPILMLTARGDEVDKVKGLAQGADDYMTKPFGVQEFVARVEALIRRAEQPPRPSARPGTVRLGNFLLDASARRVVIDDKEVKMSPREFNLLYYLLEHAGRVHSRETLLRAVWGADFHGDSKTVAVHIRWLREKFETFPTMPFRISTVFGVGYRVDLAPGVQAEH